MHRQTACADGSPARALRSILTRPDPDQANWPPQPGISSRLVGNRPVFGLHLPHPQLVVSPTRQFLASEDLMRPWRFLTTAIVLRCSALPVQRGGRHRVRLHHIPTLLEIHRFGQAPFALSKHTFLLKEWRLLPASAKPRQPANQKELFGSVLIDLRFDQPDVAAGADQAPLFGGP